MPRENLSGKKFGKLTVLDYAGTNTHGARLWTCQCECGNIIKTDTSSLKQGKRKSCSNCSRKHYKLEGQRFGRLTVMNEVETSKAGSYWLCRCDCGNEIVTKGNSLVSGKTMSCGCYSKDMLIRSNTKHGKARTRIYNIWLSMRARCNSPNNPNYKYYGAKGITVCDEWNSTEGFVNFYNWAVTNGYEDSLSIDRIDFNKGYSPSNCRWATWQQQIENRSCTVYMTYNGETKTTIEWSKITGLSRKLLNDRKRRGWDDEKSLTTPKLN